ncbi:MAG: hypothetical protein C0593_12730 [Marinilabiliales bacterium]|nr:MAG: hypothetical protein C0593_12730 [Marinilabiliales bacterium]
MKIPIVILFVCLMISINAIGQDIFEDYPSLQSARAGFVVFDLDKDTTLCNFRGKELFSPASNTKLFTTAMALENMPMGFRWETPVSLYGKLRNNGTFIGIMVIKSSGDPGFTSFASKTRVNPASAVIKLFDTCGIHTFKGDIWIDEAVHYAAHTPGDWLFDDLSKPWGAGVYALNFNDNVQYFMDDRDARMIWDTVGVHEFTAVADTDPGCTLLNYLFDTLNKSDIRYISKLPDVDFSLPLASDTVFSPHLPEIIKEINTESRNMWAEALLLESATQKDSTRNLAQSADSLSSFWRKRLNRKRIYFHDGSGLSPYNAVSPETIVSLLCYVSESENASQFINSLPAPGTGTLDDMEISLPDGFSIRMKSGSFTRVRCYSGYIIDREQNPVFAFSLMVNDFEGTHKDMKMTIAKFLETYFTSSRLL